MVPIYITMLRSLFAIVAGAATFAGETSVCMVTRESRITSPF
jgi:hypothetical protein